MPGGAVVTFAECRHCGLPPEAPVHTNPYAGGHHRWMIGPHYSEPFSDRYDARHPESEHDGGLGSGDWMGPWEDR